MMGYKRFRYRVQQATRAAMFELALIQVVIGLGLWALAYLIHSKEPPIVLAMSAGALVLSGVTCAAVAAQDDATNNDPDDKDDPQ